MPKRIKPPRFISEKFFKALFTLVGTTIGAGIFGLPYAFLQGGFFLSTVYLLGLGFLTLVLNLCYGEVILKTSGDHQLTGYAEIYLGKLGSRLAAISLIFGCYGALLAYIIIGGDFLSLLFNIPQAKSVFSYLFFFLAASVTFFGLRAISRIEGILVSLLLFLTFTTLFFGIPKVSFTNFFLGGRDIFLPYGVVLFAMAGSSIIPEIEEILRKEHKNLKKAIIWGTLIPLLIYFLFAVVVLGISGPYTSEDTLLGLSGLLDPRLITLGALVGLLNIATSFFTLVYVLRETYFRDFHLGKLTSWLLACFVPLIFFIFRTPTFVEVIGATGSWMIGLTCILIMLIFLKAKIYGERKSEYEMDISLPLVQFSILLFLLGMLYQFLYFFK